MDTKELAGKAIFAVAILYVLTAAARRGTRFEARKLEWVFVAMLFAVLFIVVPVFFGAV